MTELRQRLDKEKPKPEIDNKIDIPSCDELVRKFTQDLTSVIRVVFLDNKISWGLKRGSTGIVFNFFGSRIHASPELVLAMAGRDLEVDVYEFLQRIQLEQFFEKIERVLHLTRLSHFDHVTESDLSDINMSKPEQRRLLDAVKKHKKERKKASKTRFSLRRSSKKKDSSSSGSSGESPAKHAQVKSCLINESSLKVLGELGDGAFGVVNKGEWTASKGNKVAVAVKSLKFSDKDAFVKEQDNFMREATAMSDLDHPNVVRLYGIVLATPIKLIIELAPLGSLHDRLRTEPQSFLVSTLYDFVLQIASGMSYLESKRYVHRDLAARNILLASYDKVKIGDFGLMRQLSTEDDVYVMNPAGKVAVAWCAPECLKNREFSHASDVWAFGITVIEMFLYGRQPWDGLTAVQILDIIDEPANGRPGKPDHCPDRLYSLLIEHCWDPSPKERSKFSCIKDKLQEAVPEDVTAFFDLENGSNPDKLVAKSGDVITVLTWKSRLGAEFAKGQNKRTGEVGYFPSSPVTRNILKGKSSGSRPRIPKVKDISPPLHNSFTHCAHRGHGETPDWGTIMSKDRLVVGKPHPLNLPTKLIPLNNSDGGSQIQCEASDSAELDTCSMMSRDGSNYCSNLSLGKRSWADSGYYSNRDTYMSQDYEPMSGSSPIAIPGNSPQGRHMIPQGVNTQGTFTPIPHFPRRPSGTSLQFDPNGQRCRGDSLGFEVPPIVVNGLELRPALPAKQGAIGNHGNMKPIRSAGFQFNEGNGNPNDENLYENTSKVPGTKYEEMQRLSPVSHRVPGRPSMSSSPESVYMNQQDMGSQESIGFVNINYPIIYDRPAKDQLFDCQMHGRCNSFPEFDLRRAALAAKRQRRDSFSSEKGIPMKHPLCESKSVPILDGKVETTPNSESWETRTADEALSEDIYENIEIYNVPQPLVSEIPPPLPFKRRPSEKRRSANRNSGSQDSDISKKLPSSEKVSEEHYSRPVSMELSSSFDSHLYAEISDQLIEKLGLEDQGEEIGEDGSLGVTNGHSNASFTEISKDYADLDAICAKLRKMSHADAQPAENANEAEDELAPCPGQSRSKTMDKDDVLWRRFSTDQHRIEQHTRRPSGKRRSVNGDDHAPSDHSETRRSSSSSNRSLQSNNSLKHPCSELEGVQSLHTRTTLVTTV